MLNSNLGNGVAAEIRAEMGRLGLSAETHITLRWVKHFGENKHK